MGACCRTQTPHVHKVSKTVTENDAQTHEAVEIFNVLQSVFFIINKSPPESFTFTPNFPFYTLVLINTVLPVI